MKIAQVNVYFQPFMLGGAEWYVYNMSSELVKLGHEVHVFTANRYNGSTAPQSESIDGISVHRLPLKIDLTYRAKVWDGLREGLEEGSFDVVHSYDYAQPHSVTAMRAGRQSGSGTVLTIFDVHSMIPRVWYKRLPMRVMDGYMARRSLPSADRVLFRSPNLIEPMSKLTDCAGKAIVTPSGIRDDCLSNFEGGAFRSKYDIDGAPMLLFLGRLNPQKGPQDLLEVVPSVLKEFPTATFIFVGPDQSGYRSHLESRAAELGVSPNVRFLGPILDFQDKMSAYAASDVFVLPTAYEGTSQAIFEAMSQSRPIIANRVGGVPYQITDGVEGYLVEKGDLAELSSRIRDVLRDKNLAAEMGRRGRERVSSNRYSSLAATMCSIYEEVRRAN
ncbi:MAG TPA: glycosyltransferase family 4 protein [Nitrososphaerales archaeon]|nr:glycosyltransferase family 4 protein [Nitrososphaerales archaeon]